MKRFLFFLALLLPFVCTAAQTVRNIDSEPPFRLGIGGLILYTAVIIGLCASALYLILAGQRKKSSDEKIRFFINAAHDIRTPLTLIKAPLEELTVQERLSDNGRSNVNIALRNVNALLHLTTNLVNFEHTSAYSANLYIAPYELNAYISETVETFRSYADVKQVALTYAGTFTPLNVWIDKDKMDAILKNLLSNALKYTPEGGRVDLSASEAGDTWSIEVKDTGIGVPASEQKKLFHTYYRGTNAINSKISGSGIGLLLAGKFVRLHQGKLSFSSEEGKGFCVKITFPKGEKHFSKAVQCLKSDNEKVIYSTSGVPVGTPAGTPVSTPQTASVPEHEVDRTELKAPDSGPLRKILIVETNDELREYLRNTLSEQYDIEVCSTGRQAHTTAKEYQPDLIITDIALSDLRGDELCPLLKNDINTSHIPLILLTELTKERNTIEGLQSGADEYIVKPFSIGILRASIANLLANRMLLRHKYANLELNEDNNGTDCINCSTDIDWKFVATVKKEVEANMDQPNFNVDVLCNLMNMSRTSFYNKIKALTDQAPADYIRLIRLKNASQLLKEQRYSITEVSEKTGFSDAKYFREVFKKHFKMSPSQYAKMENEPDNRKRENE